MSRVPQRLEGSISTVRSRTNAKRKPETKETEPPIRTETETGTESEERSIVDTRLFRAGRLLFGGVLALNAIDNLRNLEERVAYAESKGAPYPEVSVPAISGGLLLGSLGIALWRVPSAAAAAVVGFLASVTPVMHDFWNQDDPERKQQELIHFLKNTALLGAALAFLRLGRRTEST